jgi:hypothetical protein
MSTWKLGRHRQGTIRALAVTPVLVFHISGTFVPIGAGSCALLPAVVPKVLRIVLNMAAKESKVN